MVEDQNVDECVLGGRALSNPWPGEEVVISGLSTAFPEATNVHEIRDHLFNKVDMVTPGHRWDYKHPELPTSTGMLPEIDKYDAGFFGLHERQSHSLDTMGRLLQEKAVEAIFDAGLHPADLEGTRTGVFLGICFSESDKSWFCDNLTSHTYAFTGAERSMLAHRISYFLKLRGPSYITDTACSSSLYAFENAYRAIRVGEVDAAIVGGASLCLHPFVSLQFARLGVLSPDGSCKAFDEAGNGYARSDAVGVLILQKSKDAKRIYAQVLHAKTNCDGYKSQGITFPSGPAQVSLLNEFYEECDVDRYSLSYVEAHGTGTLVGDPEEGNAIDVTLTKKRKTPLLIGSTKSNIGHSEPVSGICAITKCIIAMENGFIPPNIHYNTPRKEIKGLIEGRLEVVTEKIPFRDDRGLLAINSFGFGGGNCHILVRKNLKEKVNSGIPEDNLPRLVCVSGRTEEAITCLQNGIVSNKLDAEYVSLLHNVFRKNIQNHLYRGYIVVSKKGEIARSTKLPPIAKSNFHIAFGELHNWYHIGSQLMEFSSFADSVQRTQQYLGSHGTHICNALLHKSAVTDNDNILGSLAVQIGIVDILNVLELKPTASFGYSFGELVSAYYDGILNLEETIKGCLIINESLNKTNDFKIYNGNQSDNNKGKVQGKEGMLNGDHDIGEHAANGDLHLNGSDPIIEDLAAILKTSNSSAEKESWFQKISKSLEKVRNHKSTNNKNMSKSINNNSVVFKIGSSPVNVTQGVKILSFPTADGKSYVVQLLNTLGSLYECGFNPQIAKLYPTVDFPVSRGTEMISPFIKWNHNRQMFVPQYDQDIINEAQHGARGVKVQITDQEWSYIEGHIVDGRNLFPATGYLYMVWQTLALIKGVSVKFMNVVFENCKFIRATAMAKKGYLQFNITVQKGTGNFEVVEGDSPVVTGRIYEIEEEQQSENISYDLPDIPKSEALPLTSKDIYKELRLRGYHYKGAFRALQECDNSAVKGRIKWENNWVTFMDNMLQMAILQADSRLLYVPTFISKLAVNAKGHMDWIGANYNEDEFPSLPVTNNYMTGVISCGGIHIKGLIASSINRRKILADPVLESYRFVPNFMTLDAHQSVRVNMQLILENTLSYKVNAVELIDEFTKDAVPLLTIIHSVLGDQPLIQPFLKILSQTPLDIDIEVEDKKLNSVSNCLLVVASSILERPEVTKEALAALSENGFIISRESPDYNVPTDDHPKLTIISAHRTPTETLLLLQKKTEHKPQTFIKISSSDEFSWVATVKEAIKNKVNDDIVLYSENEPDSGLVGLVNCLRREPNGKNIKCVFVLDEIKQINLKTFSETQLKKNMAVNVYKNGQWGTYRHLLLNGINVVEREHCFVNSLVRGDLSSLTWLEGPLNYNTALSSEQELVHIYYTALNFRDVMTALGKVTVDVVTTDRRQQECVQGFEFSGRDIRGNRVMGMITNMALATMAAVDRYLLLKIPDSWTMADGATAMTLYGTLAYGLFIRGQLKRGESILIHSGTGGIGQAAIRLALYYGCTVFTTVGTQEKREFIRKTYPEIEDSHIGNSRDLSFEHMVHKGTNGRGVDMVVNSLADDKLLASVRCLARGGRFIEIGKFDMALNTYINLQLLQRSASFHGVMLDQLFAERPFIKKKIMDLLVEGIENGAIKPLNKTIFKVDEVEQAFRYMASGKHTGKVLVQVRTPEEEIIAAPIPQKFSCMPRYLCDPAKTYIICGGLGGFGLELADWLVLRGAKNLILTSRKGITTGYQNLRIRIWTSYGTIVKISKADICTEDGCKQLLEEASELGPVDSIFNLAVVLADAIFENQTPETFQTSFAPKVNATRYLDDLTRTMCPYLSHFVVFSSVSCGRGNAGQTNYGMANSVMERLCEKRREDGYPALAIEWGAVGEVGLVAEMQEEHIEMEIGGTLQQRISNCLQVLDTLLAQKEAAIVSSMVVAEKRGGDAAADNIVDSVINILGLTDKKTISLHSTLPELGMDSMTGVEIKQTLEREYEIFLTPKDMRTITLARLKEMHEEQSGATQADKNTENRFGFEMLFTTIGDVTENNLPYMRLKSKVEETSSAPKVLIFPGIEGVASYYEFLSSQLDAHVICLQYSSESKEETIADMANAVIPVIEEHVTKDDPINIIAYSYGTLVALEAVSILESRGYKCSVICIEGSPKLMKGMLDALNMESTEVLETALACRLLSFYLPLEAVSTHQESIFKCASWDERVELGIEIVKQNINVDQNHQRKVANRIYRRVQALKMYTPAYDPLESDVKLYKAKYQVTDNIEEDYCLSQLFKKPVEFEVFEGNHATVLDNEELANTVAQNIK